MIFADWLRQRMLERKMSQADLARATGRSTNIVSLWYRGIKRPGVRSVSRLALALGVAEAEVLRALNAALPEEPPGDVSAALMRRIPKIPLSPSEIHLVCEMTEAFMWIIHRWGRHERFLEEEDRLRRGDHELLGSSIAARHRTRDRDA
jgi:transcriptional regulator with XRE-family HTH domain